MQFDPKILKLLRMSLSGDRRHLVIRSAASSEQTTEYSFVIEEEYFLADASNFEVAIRTPNELFEAANWSTGGQAMREMLQAQLEVATNIHLDTRDAREELKFLQREVAGRSIRACRHGVRHASDGGLAAITAQPEASLRSYDRRSEDNRSSQYALWNACACPATKG